MRLEVGRIDKPHGVLGEVIVSLTSDRDERVAPGATFDTDEGPLVIERARPHQHRFIVKLAGVDQREHADELRGLTLYGEPIDDPDALWVHDLIDAPVVDVDGRELGRVEAVEENPASDLLVLGDGGLVPLTFFIEQRSDRTIVVDPPAGLLDPADD